MTEHQYQRGALAGLIALQALVAGMLTGCDGTPISDDQMLCDSLNGRHFAVAELNEMGSTLDGVAMGHWRAEFRNGTVLFKQSDAYFALDYSCAEGAVNVTTANGLEPLNFNDAQDAFSFAPLGDVKLYQEYTPLPATDACQRVSNREFLYSSFTPPDDFVPDPDVHIAQPIINLNFAENSVEIERGGQQAIGIFDCDLGVMHIHMSDTDTSPMLATIDSTASQLTVNWAGVDVHLTANDGDQEQQSSASSSSDPATSPSHCTEYAEFCSLVTDHLPCDGLPCPAPRYFTYANDCTAPADAPRLFWGSCGDLEGTTPTELATSCPANYEPVCGKLPPALVCVTEPCESNPYRTFSNACHAKASFAQVVFAGTCGNLEDVHSVNIQAAKIVADLPAARKSVTIVSSEIKGDELAVRLGYSGCDEQNFSMLVDETPVNNGSALNIMFQASISDNCDAAPTVELRYDLRPIAEYFDVSGDGIELPGIGIYRP